MNLAAGSGNNAPSSHGVRETRSQARAMAHLTNEVGNVNNASSSGSGGQIRQQSTSSTLPAQPISVITSGGAAISTTANNISEACVPTADQQSQQGFSSPISSAPQPIPVVTNGGASISTTAANISSNAGQLVTGGQVPPTGTAGYFPLHVGATNNGLSSPGVNNMFPRGMTSSSAGQFPGLVNNEFPGCVTSAVGSGTDVQNSAPAVNFTSMMRPCGSGENVVFDNALLNSNVHDFNLVNNPLVSICSPLGADLPIAKISKIINGEFVDLASLLPVDTLTYDNSHNVNDKGAGGMAFTVNQMGQLAWVDNSRSKRSITSIHMWTDAFLVFSSIYLLEGFSSGLRIMG